MHPQYILLMVASFFPGFNDDICINFMWDDRISAVIPDEDIFYKVGLLRSCRVDDWEAMVDQNKQILHFCDKAGINCKLYLHRFDTKQDWINHFGHKWKVFKQMKAQFDPKFLLTPGQNIFHAPSSPTLTFRT